MIPRLAIFIVGTAAFFLAPHFLAEYHLFQICLIAATALVVLGLVVVTGLAGQISLAQSAFVGLGGYCSAIFATFCRRAAVGEYPADGGYASPWPGLCLAR